MNFLKMFSNWKEMEEHKAKTIIFEEGAQADALYVIMSGEVELSLRGESLGVEGVGGIIGEMAISPSAQRSSTAIALTDVQLARLTRYQLNMLMSKSNDFSHHVMTVLANRLRAVNQFITVQFESAK